ncbi:MAG: hypothetical protein IPH91_09770 [Elusimicrobia bacterium]|nr:hypothetical protein [Elusimicrobiota bacterium]MBK7688612.1 hypothetical protein [Elusimicrobiota bacterium]MBK8126960.1 hypothetical protein [Elusimicrobiota bacterium]
MKTTSPGFVEIHGFQTTGEFNRFVEFLKTQVNLGILQEIPSDPAYSKGEIVGGRWFREIKSGKVWRLIDPDPPFRGLWEMVGKQ